MKNRMPPKRTKKKNKKRLLRENPQEAFFILMNTENLKLKNVIVLSFQ